MVYEWRQSLKMKGLIFVMTNEFHNPNQEFSNSKELFYNTYIDTILRELLKMMQQSFTLYFYECKC